MSLHRIFEDAAAAGRKADKDSRRRKAESYTRDIGNLFLWTFPGSRATIAMCAVNPHAPRFTRALCHRLYRDIQIAENLPRYIVGKHNTIDELRTLFTCECSLYRKQRDSVKAQKSAADFLNGMVT